MEALELKAEVRDITGRHVKHLRQGGMIPAVLYGQDVEATSLQINEKALIKVLRQAGTHQLISLQIGHKKPQMTLARDIQRDPLKHRYLHVDFYAVKMSQKVTAQVPLVFVGSAPAVSGLGGILTHGLDEIEIECLPADLIAAVEVDVSGLAHFNDSIIISDLQLPNTVTVLSDPDSMVAKVEAPRTVEALEEEEEEVGVAVSVEPEVLAHGKEKLVEEEED